MIRTIALLLSLLAYVGLMAQVPPPEHSSAIDIYEAVVRYQIKTWDLAASTYCIEVNGKDASPELLGRLRPLPVKGKSGCKEKKHILMDIVDKRTKKLAVIFDVSEIHWQSASEADVQGGYFCASQCGGGGKYHVVWNGHQWTVTDFKPELMI